MYTNPDFSQYTSQMANGYFVSNRKDKSRKAKEVPPPVDASPLSRYDELVASLQTSVSPTTHSQPTSAITTTSSQSPYPNAYHHHPHHSNPHHHHTHSSNYASSIVTDANISPRAGRAPPSPHAQLVAQYEHFSITNGSPNGGGANSRNSTPVLQPVGIARRDSSSVSTAAAQRRQELARLHITNNGNKNDDDDATNNGVNNSMTDPAHHALTRHTMPDPYQYRKVLAADYHRLPPPVVSGGDFGGGEGERRVSERERYYSSSPSSSPGLSPTSSGSSPIEVDVDHLSFRHTNNINDDAPAHGRLNGSIRSTPTAACVVAPTPVRAYTASPKNQQSPATPHPTQRLPSAFVYREPYTSAPSPVPTPGAAIHSMPPTHAYGAQGGVGMAGTGKGMVIVDTPQPVVALPSSGSQTFERGGELTTMIDATTARSREDEKVLHQLSKDWKSFF
jgi:hypothetical protein